MDTTKRNTAITALLAAGAAAGAYFALVRPRHIRWGATKEEAEGYLPGDELVPKLNQRATHAITIDAPAEFVWPWFVQLGQDKAGFYSYTALENLVGCHMKNAHEIHSEWQHIQAGDRVKFHPNAPTVPVVIAENERNLVLGVPNEFTWGFFLRPMGDNQTRLIIRLQSARKPLQKLADYLFIEPAHFIMERKMMLTVKALAEEFFRSECGTPDEESMLVTV